ncbi:MAG TPA: hypothetical protein VKR58_12750 [Aquella sp.]|nr:hypothetical protein [Aquella sp.]
MKDKTIGIAAYFEIMNFKNLLKTLFILVLFFISSILRQAINNNSKSFDRLSLPICPDIQQNPSYNP